MSEPVLLKTDLPGLRHLSSGKVRDMFDLGDSLLIVTTDRLSAFDVVMANGIPWKGKVLNRLSEFWFALLDVPHHLITCDVARMPAAVRPYQDLLRDRAMQVRKATPFPVECVARGYLIGSGWNDYRATGAVCGIPLPAGLAQAARLPEPIFTPSTKAAVGEHDENIDFDKAAAIIGLEQATKVRDAALRVYKQCADYALTRGIIIADTKFEFGVDEKGTLTLIDEVLTPDSSRFWPADQYKPGANPPSYDKQYVRDWLEGAGWDKNSPPPRLPETVVAGTRARYVEALVRLVGRGLAGVV
jgi:phosphoribosylaminoimidazole-succinocarboxamide synthase